MPPHEATAQKDLAGARRLDFHHHFGSPRWIKRELAMKRQGWGRFVHYSPANSIELMDRNGIQTAFLSCTEPGVWFGDDFRVERDQAVDLAHDMNEFGARLMSDYKGRFGLFAVLPLPDVDASLKEIEYALDTLHADGIGVVTSYADIWLGDDRLQPVFDELNRRGAIVFVHPTDATCCHDLAHANPSTVEWLSDTGRSINSLLSTAPTYFYGQSPLVPPARTSAATRYGNVKFIWSHGGGSLISIADRVVGDISAETLAQPAAMNSKLYHLRRFHYDTAGSANPILMQGLKSLVGASQIVFGTDVPFGDPAKIVTGLSHCGFTEEELRGINRENALRILPRYRTA